VRTRLCDLLQIETPIIQAPIGSATTPALAAAVSNAGGLGMLAVSWRESAELRTLLRATRDLTDRRFGVNLVLQWDQRARLDIALAEGVRIVSLFWGDPTPYLARIHAAGALAIHAVGDVVEASAAAAAGVDIIVAQGWEAGGHVRGRVAMSTLVPRVCDAVAPRPVVAAGGIGDGRGIAAALALGADGVWLGTRFLATEEAGVHPSYREALVHATEADTVYATLFDGGWPDAPHRMLRNRTVRIWEAAGCPPPGRRPGEGEVLASYPDGRAVLRYSDTIPVAGMTGAVEELALYAGQSVAFVTGIQSAAATVRELTREADEALERCRAIEAHGPLPGEPRSAA
jgi:nitronate monooxygenase